jgi:hydrogenase expression/formation protein HypE
LNAIIEEGFEIARLDRIVASLAAAAREAGVSIVAGDTKVVRRGEAGGLYLVAAGVGVRPRGLRLGVGEVRSGDVLLVSGPIGDHGTAVLLAREEFGLRGDLASDSGASRRARPQVHARSDARWARHGGARDRPRQWLRSAPR